MSEHEFRITVQQYCVVLRCVRCGHTQQLGLETGYNCDPGGTVYVPEVKP